MPVIYDPRPIPAPRCPVTASSRERFDKPSALMISLLPEPNQASPSSNYFKTVGRVQDQNDVDIRVDYLLDFQTDSPLYTQSATGIRKILPIFPRLSGHLITPKSRVKPRSYSLNYTRRLERGVSMN